MIWEALSEQEEVKRDSLLRAADIFVQRDQETDSLDCPSTQTRAA